MKVGLVLIKPDKERDLSKSGNRGQIVNKPFFGSVIFVVVFPGWLLRTGTKLWVSYYLIKKSGRNIYLFLSEEYPNRNT